MWGFGNSIQRRPTLPDGYRVYAVGDVHGRDDLLSDVFARIDADLAEFPSQRPMEVYLGDYIDRGPRSCTVVNQLITRSRFREVVLLKGNHEVFLMSFLADPSILKIWGQYGGFDTLISYGLRPRLNPTASYLEQASDELQGVLSEGHLGFYEALLPYFSLGDFYFVHAGVKPLVPLSRQSESDLLWIRDEFLVCESPYEKMIVHGHTPVREPEFWPNRINIDTGAYATGRLTCLRIEADQIDLL